MTRATVSALLCVVAVALAGCGEKAAPAPVVPDASEAVERAKRDVDAGKGLLGGFCSEQLATGKFSEAAVTDCLRRAYDAYKDDVPQRGAPTAP